MLILTNFVYDIQLKNRKVFTDEETYSSVVCSLYEILFIKIRIYRKNYRDEQNHSTTTSKVNLNSFILPYYNILNFY